MGRTVLITGGARSGKSRYAEQLAQGGKGEVLYLATAVPFDEEMKDRIGMHKASRPEHWQTYEGYQGLGDVVREKTQREQVVLMDCITLLITNLLFDHPGLDEDNPSAEVLEQVEQRVYEEITGILEVAEEKQLTVVMVTNEVGWGLVPETKLARMVRDVYGRVNQFIGHRVDELYLLVCGIPMKIK